MMKTHVLLRPILWLMIMGWLGTAQMSWGQAVPEFEWARKAGSANPGLEWGGGIVLDAQKNVYTVGTFYDVIDFDRTDNDVTTNPQLVLQSSGFHDIFVTKQNPAGQFLWARRLGGQTGNDRGNAIALHQVGTTVSVYLTGEYGSNAADFTNNIYTAADVFNPGGGTNVYICKLNGSDGTKDWVKSIGAFDNGFTNTRSYGIDADLQGNVYLTGHFTGKVNFDPNAAHLATDPEVLDFGLVGGGFTGFVSKLSVNGNYVWARKLSTTSGGFENQSQGRSVVVDKATGDVYTTGVFYGTGDFNPGAGVITLTVAGGPDAFVTKYDINGEINGVSGWAVPLSGQNAGHDILLVGSTVYLTGFSKLTSLQKSNGALVNTYNTPPNTATDSYNSIAYNNGYVYSAINAGLAQYGNVQFTKIYRTKLSTSVTDVVELNGDITGTGIAADAAQNIHLTGFFSGTRTFPPILTPLVSNNSTRDIYIGKFKFCTPPAAPVITAAGPTSFCQGGSVVLSANTPVLWYLNNVLQSLTPSLTRTAIASGTYTAYQKTNGCTSGVSNSISVTVTPLPPTPVITPSGPITLCAGESVTLTAPAGTGYAYLWSGITPAPTTQSITVTTSGTYRVRIIANGCTSLTSAAVVVTIKPVPVKPVLTANGPLTFCDGGNVVLTATGPACATEYVWSGPGTTGVTVATFTATQSGTYTVYAKCGTCLSPVSLPKVVVVKPLPATPVIKSCNASICGAGTAFLVAPSGSNYVWLRNGTSINNTPDAAGDLITGTTRVIEVTAPVKPAVDSYTLQTVGANGCTSLVSTPVQVQDITPDAPVLTSVINANNSVTLSVPFVSGTLVTWRKDGNAIPNLINTTSTTYTTASTGVYTVVRTVNCCSSVESNPITYVYSAPAPCNVPAPTSLAVSTILFDNYNYAIFSWAAIPNATYYYVYYKVQGSTSGTNTAFTFASSNPSVTVSNLLPNTTYEWYVVAYCSGGSPSTTNGLPFLTTGGTGICPTPTNLGTSVDPVTNDRTFTWNATGAPEYKFFYKSTTAPGGFTELVAPSNQLTLQFGFFSANTTYQWYVQAVCSRIASGATTSGNSTILSFTTDGMGARFGDNGGEGLINPSTAEAFNVFPNPTSGILNLELNAEAGELAIVEITDLIGKEVFKGELRTGNTQTIDLKGFGRGLYNVHVIIGDKVIMKQVVLE